MTEKEISKQITRYINGALTEQEEDLLWEEFLENRKYYDLFETELNLTDLFQNKKFRVDDSDNYNSFNSPTNHYSIAVASIAALLLTSVMLYTFMFQSNVQPGSYALSEIELTQMLGSDIFRDESPDTGMLDQQINQALSLAFSGNGEEATELLNSLTSEPYTGIQKIRIHYNLGILAYNEGDFDLSLNNFSELNEQLPESTPEYIVENTQWYISNVYLQQGQIDKAIQQLRIIASGDGSHHTRAANLLSSLTEN